MAVSSAASRALHSLLVVQPRRALLILSCAKKRHKSSIPIRYVPKGVQIGISNNKAATDSIRNKPSKTTRDCLRVPPNLYDNDDDILQTSDTFEQNEEFSEDKNGTNSALELADIDSRNKSGLFRDNASTSQGNSNTDGYELVISKIREEAENMAIKLLAARAFTAVELQKKLRSKKFPLNVVDSVITDMKCRGLLNDGLYAESFSQSRWLSSTWGPRRIKQALMQKGVSESEVHKATKQVFEEEDPADGSSYTQHGMSKLSMDHLLLQASKQWLRGRDMPIEKRKSRIVRWLQYRGFNWGVTNLILKKLESQYPP